MKAEAPPGALTKEQLREMCKHPCIIYKAYNRESKPKKIEVLGEYNGWNYIATKDPTDSISVFSWFPKAGKGLGYLFENYFHAYAYCLKCKEHKRG